MIQGVIFNINRYAVHDGPGIRVTVFMQGCPLRCWWCHNPEGMDALDPAALVPDGEEGRCSKVPSAVVAPPRVVTVEQLVAEIERDWIFMEESGGGVTFSGGEPLLQPEFLNACLDACRARGIATAIDTSGYAAPKLFREAARRTDLVLYDLKLMDDAAHRRYVGKPLGPVLDNLWWLAMQDTPAWIVRVPVIPGITDTEANLAAMGKFLADLGKPVRMSLLPYHRTAQHKYERLGLPDRMAGVEPPSADHLAAIRERFERLGFTVGIGG